MVSWATSICIPVITISIMVLKIGYSGLIGRQLIRHTGNQQYISTYHLLAAEG